MFSGFGGVCSGFKDAGYELVGAVERDAYAAKTYELNFGSCALEDVCDHNYRQVHTDHLHGSPSCKEFSRANPRGGESESDILCSKAFIRAIVQTECSTVSLENVREYKDSKSFALIKSVLRDLGFATNVANINAKDFGVPQSRERLILRAWLKNSKRPRPLSLYKTKQHIGWYEAIADIIPTLKPLPLNGWQLASLAEQGISVEGLTALVSKDGSRKKKGFISTFALLIPPEKPCPTLKALGHSQHCQQYSIVVDGVGYRISTQAIARLMSFPNSFKFLGTNYTDCMGLGNAVPPLLGRAIAQSFN